MKSMRLFAFALVFMVASWPSHAQEGHPLTGTWTGDVGQRHVTLALEWDGKAVTGTINPGPNAWQIRNSTVDPSTWTVHLDAEGSDRISIDGRVTEIGSASRTMNGTWTQGSIKTPITLTRVDSTSVSSNSGALPSEATYDNARRVTLRGTVTNVEWINPRVRFVVSARDPAPAANWTVEVPDGATILARNGWNARSLKVGDLVIVQGVAVAGTGHQALARSVVLGKGGAQLFKLPVTTQST